MKKWVLAITVMVILLNGCKKKEEPDYASLVLGKWINVQVDGKAVLTDASFVCEFRSDHVQTYATGFVLDSNNRTWIENSNYTYSVSGDLITIDGSNELGSHFHMVFRILSADGQTLSYSVSRFMIDNVEYPDPKIYTHRKVSADLSGQLAGTWYGSCTTPGNSDTSHHYWQYFNDGRFNYYYRDSTGTWVNKPDNEGKYFLYGNLLATNYTNDLLSGGTGKAYECWNIAIQDQVMTWTGARENGLIAGFRMNKVPAPPVAPVMNNMNKRR